MRCHMIQQGQADQNRKAADAQKQQAADQHQTTGEEVLPRSPFGGLLFRVMSCGTLGFLLATGSVYGAEKEEPETKAQQPTNIAQKTIETGFIADDIFYAMRLTGRV